MSRLPSPAIALLLGVFVLGCGGRTADVQAPAEAHPTSPGGRSEDPDDYPTGITEPVGPPPAGLAAATFAGGCFWCMEAAFERVPGVRDAVSGYTGGPEQHPRYDDVSNHRTGHAEAVRVLYDPAAVTYAHLLEVFFRHADPTAVDRAFVDEGPQYRSVIYVASAAERAAAEQAKAAMQASGRFDGPIVTTIEDAGVFWVAEAYHQDFYRTHPNRYEGYHEHSGRREALRARWGPDAEY